MAEHHEGGQIFRHNRVVVQPVVRRNERGAIAVLLVIDAFETGSRVVVD